MSRYELTGYAHCTQCGPLEERIEVTVLSKIPISKNLA